MNHLRCMSFSEWMDFAKITGMRVIQATDKIIELQGSNTFIYELNVSTGLYCLI